MKLHIAQLSSRAVLLAGFTLLSFNAVAEAPATDAGCLEAWNKSEAAGKCVEVKISATTNSCEITARCLNSNGAAGETTTAKAIMLFTNGMIVDENGAVKLSKKAALGQSQYVQGQ